MPILSVTTMQQALLRLDSIASQVSTTLLALGPDDLDGAFERTLRSLVEALDGREATLLEHAEDASLFDIVSTWSRAGSAPDGMDDAGGSLTVEIAQHIDGDQPRTLRIPEDLSPEAIDRLGPRLEHIGSAIGVPVRVAGHRVCALIVTSARDASVWDQQLVSRIQLLAEILTYAVHRRRQARTLRLREAELTRLSTQLKSEAVYLREEIQTLHGFNEIIGDSEVLRDALDRVREVASTDATVLLLGETGTGKELCARVTHLLSNRHRGPFIPVDCGALPDHLFENEVFRHPRGAYTDARNDQKGRVALAQGGTKGSERKAAHF